MSPQKEPTRFCVDCIHFEPYASKNAFMRTSFARCGRTPAKLNAVTGTPRKAFCDTERTSRWPDNCGPAGSYYEPAQAEADKNDVIP